MDMILDESGHFKSGSVYFPFWGTISRNKVPVSRILLMNVLLDPKGDLDEMLPMAVWTESLTP